MQYAGAALLCLNCKARTAAARIIIIAMIHAKLFNKKSVMLNPAVGRGVDAAAEV